MKTYIDFKVQTLNIFFIYGCCPAPNFYLKFILVPHSLVHFLLCQSYFSLVFTLLMCLEGRNRILVETFTLV